MEEFSRSLSVENDESFISVSHIVGCMLIMIISGLSSLAGLGGGSPNITLLILFFNVLPKDATIMVFACVFGSACGNMVNQMRRVLDGQPVVNYGYASFTIPLMFIGTLFGVLLNKFLPSLGTVSLILIVAFRSLPAIYNRFQQGYAKQTQQKKKHDDEKKEEAQTQTETKMEDEIKSKSKVIIKETKVNPFASEQNLTIFKSLLLMICGYIILSLLKGSQKYPSIVGIQNCSAIFWGIQVCIVLLAGYFFKIHINLYCQKNEELIDKNKSLIVKNSLGAGMLSGLGLGGGIFLVPLYRQLNSTPVQASSTGAFTVFITAGLNVVQALFLGIISVQQFFFLFSLTFFGGYLISFLVSRWLRRINRTSMVQFLLFFLILIASLLLPYSIWTRVQRQGGDWSIVLGFGSLC